MSDPYQNCPVDENGNPHQYFSPYGCPTSPPTYPPVVNQVPEPSGLALVLVALAIVAFVRRAAP
jgi:hypothetical protein